MKGLYHIWLETYKHFPKVERFGLGQKIDSIFIELFELVLSASYASSHRKYSFLSNAVTKVDALKFFFQFSWEEKLINTDRYSQIILTIEELGRMIGGWKKDTEQKLPPHR
jgi:hypothetical protein